MAKCHTLVSPGFGVLLRERLVEWCHVRPRSGSSWRRQVTAGLALRAVASSPGTDVLGIQPLASRIQNAPLSTGRGVGGAGGLPGGSCHRSWPAFARPSQGVLSDLLS